MIVWFYKLILEMDNNVRVLIGIYFIFSSLTFLVFWVYKIKERFLIFLFIKVMGGLGGI